MQCTTYTMLLSYLFHRQELGTFRGWSCTSCVHFHRTCQIHFIDFLISVSVNLNHSAWVVLVRAAWYIDLLICLWSGPSFAAARLSVCPSVKMQFGRATTYCTSALCLIKYRSAKEPVGHSLTHQRSPPRFPRWSTTMGVTTGWSGVDMPTSVLIRGCSWYWCKFIEVLRGREGGHV